MCCVCEGSTLTDHNSYWYQDQWERAVMKALEYGQRTGRKQRLTLKTLKGPVNGPIKGWTFKDAE